MSVETTALFLDRDGTINVEAEYLSDPDRVELIPGSAEAIREANETGIRVFVITNQSGVARGLYTEADILAVHQRLEELLAARGAKLDALYYCPHHPDVGSPPYRIVCSCRKPKTGMLEQAAKTHGIDLASSFVVGDKCSDIEAGKNARCATTLVMTGYGRIERDRCRPDHIADNLYEAWHHIRGILQSRKKNA
ncbi:MAG: D,D-heptose 1,7-bisphosphate phosphatase [Bacteroidia bacterium]|nr:MAG: D,D-heptose 1,7-bisphosphate phosphatase [Bacteroidia bacterium]